MRKPSNKRLKEIVSDVIENFINNELFERVAESREYKNAEVEALKDAVISFQVTEVIS